MPSLPVARQETAVVALHSEIVVIGGFDGFGANVATVEAFNPDTNAWRRLADLPTPAHHANAGVVDGALVVAGFLTGVELTPHDTVLRYDAANDRWDPGAPMP